MELRLRLRLAARCAPGGEMRSEGDPDCAGYEWAETARLLDQRESATLNPGKGCRPVLAETLRYAGRVASGVVGREGSSTAEPLGGPPANCELGQGSRHGAVGITSSSPLPLIDTHQRIHSPQLVSSLYCDQTGSFPRYPPDQTSCWPFCHRFSEHLHVVDIPVLSLRLLYGGEFSLSHALPQAASVESKERDV